MRLHPGGDLRVFLVLFPLFWLLISSLIAKFGGWSRLATVYRAYDPPRGKAMYFQSASFDLANYNSCLTFHITEQGLHISVLFPFRFGHPPLFIPWRDMLNREEKKLLFCRRIKTDVGQPKLVTLYLPAKVFLD